MRAFALSLLLLAAPAFGWFDNDWGGRLAVTVQSSQVPGDLTDYPAYLDLDDIDGAHQFWTDVQTDGDDIRVTKSDGTTEVPVEIVFIDTTAKTGEVYFKCAGTLSSSVNTVYYLYYGNASVARPAVDSTNGSENVWKAAFKAVYHCDALTDSTSNDRDLTAINSATLDSTAGPIGTKRLKFIDANSGFTFSPSLTLAGEFDISLYIYGNGPTDGICILGGSSGANDVFFQRVSDTAERFRVGNKYGTQYVDIDANWRWLLLRRNGSDEMDVFRDNVEEEAGTNTAAVSVTVDRLGDANYNTAWDMDGYFDELRVMDEEQSDDWRNTTWNNLDSPATFYVIGAHESNGGGGSPQVIRIGG